MRNATFWFFSLAMASCISKFTVWSVLYIEVEINRCQLSKIDRDFNREKSSAFGWTNSSTKRTLSKGDTIWGIILFWQFQGMICWVVADCTLVYAYTVCQLHGFCGSDLPDSHDRAGFGHSGSSTVSQQLHSLKMPFSAIDWTLTKCWNSRFGLGFCESSWAFLSY